ncbi:hypothetical protein QYF36_019445 [Acer negundo]|nr:hypothetical protein QYF36_019445 [Acer negundo]
MEAATAANVSAVSSEIQMTDAAAGSESYINSNNNIEETVASSSNNQEKNFELLDSVYSVAADGDIDRFQQHAGVLDQILTPYGNTILHIHITARRQPRSRIIQNMDFVREILEMCPELLWKANKKGETLLHMAARHGHDDVAKFLLEECKKKPKQNNHDQELGIKDTRQMLQMINEARDTALHEAVRYNHLDVVKVLAEEDRELPYDANAAGETPLYLAAERGYAEVLQEILRTCTSAADHGPNSRTALHATVIRNDIGMTTMLLDNKRIQKHDKIGRTPLHFAAGIGYVEIAKMLLIKDRSAAYKADNKGRTALHVAAHYGRVNIMQELISSCCGELVDNKGRNVLHHATKSKSRNAVRLVLQNPLFGNLINEKDEKGNTPFLEAISMLSIINHPKVDRFVSNNDNDNAVNILTKVDCRTAWKWHEFIRLLLIMGELGRGLRLVRYMSSDDYGEGKESKTNPAVSSKSKDGDENGNGNENGNDRRSRDDSVKKGRRNELVAATLIATVTFAAGFTVPGGFISEKGPDQGAAILTRNTAFKAFVILNSMSMIFSSLAVFNHLSLWPLLDAHKTESFTKLRLGTFLIVFAMLTMIGAFLSGTIFRREKHK